jgi:small subunit ribosomal protein S20
LEVSVAHSESAKKRIRSSERKRQRNRRVISATRTQIKKARQYVAAGQVEEAQDATAKAISMLDRAAQKGIIHAGNAARRKSRLAHAVNKMASAQSEPA